MRVYKTKEFSRYARRESIRDAVLYEAACRAALGSIDANPGGGLIKQWVARPGAGRRGGYRTLMAFRAGDLTIYLYGFAKSERDNIESDELAFWRKVAGGFLKLEPSALDALLKDQDIIEVTENG